MVIITDRIAIVTDPQTIVFPSGQHMPTANYNISWVYYDADYQTLGGQPVVGSKTVDGFSFTCSGLLNGTLEYSVSELGAAISFAIPIARLSRNWTAKSFYAELVRDLNLKASDALYGERFRIINRAIPEAVRKNAAVLGNCYMTPSSIDDTDSSEIIISLLKMQMGGQEARLVIESNTTVYVENVGWDEYKGFRASSFQEGRYKIIWTRQGDAVLFKKGTSLANYGTRTFRFPRTSEECTDDLHFIDYPDSFMGLAFTEGKRVLAERYKEYVGDIKFPEEIGLAEKQLQTTAQLETPEALVKAL